MYKVEVTPMGQNIEINKVWGGEFTTYEKANIEFMQLCEQLNLNNATSSYNGKEAGGIGHDYRVELTKIGA